MFRRLLMQSMRAGMSMASGPTFRSFAQTAKKFTMPKFQGKVFVTAAGTCTYAYSVTADDEYVAKVKKNEKEIRAAIAALLDGGDYDGHGSYGPIFVRLAWHSSGTFDNASKTGGSQGGCMRFAPELTYGANNGLKVAQDRLESVKQQFPFLSYADLWTLAGVVAVEELGGPSVPWRAGRSDYAKENYYKVEDGRLPDAAQGQAHVRDIFYRMGFDDREITALIGAHALGRCHSNYSGFDGPWTRAPSTFSNHFFTTLLEQKWVPRKWDGPRQFENVDGKDLMMLPADMAFLEDPKFRNYVELYAKDEEAFSKDFAKAFAKLLELGVPFKN